MYKKAIRVNCKKWSKDDIDWKSVNDKEENGKKYKINLREVLNKDIILNVGPKSDTKIKNFGKSNPRMMRRISSEEKIKMDEKENAKLGNGKQSTLMWSYWEDDIGSNEGKSKWFGILGNADEWEVEIVKNEEEIRRGINNGVMGIIDGETWVKIRRKKEENRE